MNEMKFKKSMRCTHCGGDYLQVDSVDVYQPHNDGKCSGFHVRIVDLPDVLIDGYIDDSPGHFDGLALIYHCEKCGEHSLLEVSCKVGCPHVVKFKKCKNMVPHEKFDPAIQEAAA